MDLPAAKKKRSWLRDRLRLLGMAILVCVVGAGVFSTALIFHFNGEWLVVGLAGISFFGIMARDYRQHLRSTSFVLFLIEWSVLYVAVFVVVMGRWGWLWWLLAMCLEFLLFYVTAKLIFGLDPPPRKRRSPPSNEQ